MFGHQHDEKDDDTSSDKNTTVVPDKPVDEVTSTNTADTSETADNATIKPDHPTPSAEDTKPAADSSSDDDSAWQHPGAPIDDEDDEDDDEATGPEPIKDIVGTNAGPDFRPFPQSSSSSEDTSADNTPHELIDIKQNALNDLMPLADKLDQTPEDKFRTTMMMIQASDDQSLIKTAYDAAHDIKDEKVRAQALLDIVNEINYFTQHPEN